MDAEEYQVLQVNGVYISAGGAAYNNYYQMQFKDGTFKEILLGYTEWDDAINEGIYYIGNEKDEDYDMFKEWIDDIMSEEAIYYKVKRK